MLWQKLVWNAPFNAICALTGLPAARVLDQPELETLVAEAMREVILVGRAEGATLGAPLVQLMLQLTRSQFPDTEPSMLQDLRAGRLPEIDALQGAVLRAGAKHGLPTPVHVSLHALLRGRASSVSPHWP